MRGFIAGGLMAGLLIVCGSPAYTSVGDASLNALAQSYFRQAWQDNPGQATSAGVHEYDTRLGSFSASAYATRIASTQRFLDALHHIDRAHLSTEASYDYLIFESRLQANLLSLRTEQGWRHNPSLYTSAASGAVFALIKRTFAPLDVRMRDVIAREEQIPSMLQDAAKNITSVDATTAQIEKEDIKGAAVFFGNVVPSAFSGVADAALQDRFKKANLAAIAAVKQFGAVMEAGPFAHPSGTYAIGPQVFQERLSLQELTPISLTQYERVGLAALEETKAQFVATSKKIDSSKTPQELATAIGDDHPAADELLPTAQRDLDQLRAFVVSHNLLTLPPDNDIKVVPTPVFARQTTFASMDSPGPLERVATQAYYNVTPVEPDWSTQRRESHLSFFNNYYLPIVSAHEVMPGHYVNFAIAKHEKLSLIRRLLSSPSYAEGWAHYDEQMIVDEGWGNGNPKVRLAQLQGALLREARYIVGLREHTQGMTVNEATKFFQDNAFVGEEPAHREALRGTQDPLYGYYTLGKLELMKLRRDYREKLGANFTLEKFHDAFLAHGDPPISIVRKELLGASDDAKLL
ncbi:MAG: DUF885 domain-containing protein [Candidatus Eremiobacteraeota bacterium]|nr:DUF885 domain-containing protein [Candidatus Eremiobacteraeota bacterium]